MRKLSQKERILACLSDGIYHSSNELRFKLGEPIINVPQRISDINKGQRLQGRDEPIVTRMMPGNPQNPDSALVAWYKDLRFDIYLGQQGMSI